MESGYNVNEKWTPVHEKILIDWADKATCYRWLHNKSYNKYSCQNAWLTIPVIIISTLTGTANFSQEIIPTNSKTYYSMSIGIFNLLAGLITTIKQFLKISELSVSHRISSIGWAKFNRDIKVELAKQPNDRANPDLIFKKSKEEYERLIETSPPISKYIIQSFKHSFNGRKYNILNLCNELMCCHKCRKGSYEEDPFNLLRLKVERKKIEEFAKISKPEICNTLQTTKKFTYRYMTDKNKLKNRQNDTALNVKNYYDEFYKVRNRFPDKDEMKDKFPELDDETLIRIIDSGITDNKILSNKIEISENSNNNEQGIFIFNNHQNIDSDITSTTSTESIINNIINN